jgi:hypothetical protein
MMITIRIILSVMALYLLWEEYDKRTQPTRVGVRLIGKRMSKECKKYLHKFFGRVQEYSVFIDESQKIRCVSYLSDRPFTEKDRYLYEQNHAMNSFKLIHLANFTNNKVEVLDKITVLNIWFVYLEHDKAIYEIESTDKKRYYLIEDIAWDNSLFKQNILDERVTTVKLRDRIQAVREIGRSIREKNNH